MLGEVKQAGNHLRKGNDLVYYPHVTHDVSSIIKGCVFKEEIWLASFEDVQDAFDDDTHSTLHSTPTLIPTDASPVPCIQPVFPSRCHLGMVWLLFNPFPVGLPAVQTSSEIARHLGDSVPDVEFLEGLPLLCKYVSIYK